MKNAALDRLAFERDCLLRSFKHIAGVDEAGRGPLAGPVVAAAVIFPSDWISNGLPEALDGLNDSKQLTERQREKYFHELHRHSEIRFAISIVEADVIDQINILQATHRAMNTALDELKPDHALVDGLRVKSLRWPQTPLVKGDARSYSIDAASVLAKVTRDRLMVEYDRQFPHYGFATHKGYGTARHLAALEKFGPCSIHRQSFAPVKSAQLEMFGPAI